VKLKIISRKVSMQYSAMLKKYQPHYRYAIVSLLMYGYIFGAMFILVRILQVSETWSYLITYIFAYAMDYFLTLKYVFSESHHWMKVVKFLMHVIFFLTLGTLVFNALAATGIHYLLATALTIILTFPLKIIGYRLVVR